MQGHRRQERRCASGPCLSIRPCVLRTGPASCTDAYARIPDTHQVYSGDGEVWDACVPVATFFAFPETLAQKRSQPDGPQQKRQQVRLVLLSPTPRSVLTALPLRFYVLQLLHPIGDNSSCILFTRWGPFAAFYYLVLADRAYRSCRRERPEPHQGAHYVRLVLDPADDRSQGPWPASTAINEFKKQFKAKTVRALSNHALPPSHCRPICCRQ